MVPAARLRTASITSPTTALAAVTKVFGDHDVSIRSLEQEGYAGEARLLFLTHVAREGDVRDTLAELAGLDTVERIGGVMRIVGGTEP